MKETLYRKIGKKYVPVSEYDNKITESFSKGTHLVVCKPGSTIYSYNIEPEFAPMIAAGIYARDAICTALIKASEMRPARSPITSEQQAAWQSLADSFGDELSTLHGASIQEIAQAGVDAMIIEANKMMKNKTVLRSYEHFLFLSKLTQEEKNE